MSKPLRPRLRRASLWLSAVVITWLALILFARYGAPKAMAWLEPLFAATLAVSCVLLCGALVALSSRPRQTLMVSITFALSFGVALLLLEVPAMLKLVHWRVVFDNLAGDGVYATYIADPKLGYRRPPNYRWSSTPASDIQKKWSLPPTLKDPITFTYDHKGYRNLINRDKADVVLIGDSYVEGHYVSDHETVASQLEARIGRPVANMGIAGYGTLQELLVLREDALLLSPRVVVWFFFEGNDLYDDQDFESMMLDAGWQARLGDDGWAERSLVLNGLRRLQQLSAPVVNPLPPYYAKLIGSDSNAPLIYFADYASVPWDDWIESRWLVAQDSMVQAVRIAREAGIDIIFCFLPIKFRVYQPFVQFPEDSPARDWNVWPIVDKFLELCRSAEVPCIDLTPLFQQALRQGGMPYLPEDTHWSSEGHELVAAKLAEQLGYLDRPE